MPVIRVVPLLLASVLGAASAVADETQENWSGHYQFTFIEQGYPAFHSPYEGPNSLPGGGEGRETTSGTAFLGARLPWPGGELYFDPEVNQGFGIGNTEGIEGFPNGEAQKSGFETPKPNVARLFVRQVFGLGGATETLAPDENQLGEKVDVSRVTLTAGKIAVPDIFDTNQYAHDPRTDFMNASIWESAAWDYPADQKGYTDGLAAEWNEEDWALRGGWFLEPRIANQRDLDPRFLKRYGTVVEYETRVPFLGEAGKQHFLVFLNRAPQGSYDQAVALAEAAGGPPDIALVRRDRWKAGVAIDLEQPLSDTLGVFSRLSWNDGRSEGWAFTDITQSVVLGASLKGAAWHRPDDTLAIAVAVNGTSKAAQSFFADGGLGIFAGDGKLAYAPEADLEAYYNLAVVGHLTVGPDYQFVADPAFNADRGPVSIFAVRVHAEF